MTIDKTPLGKTSDGTVVDQFTLTGAGGMKVVVMTYGATITSVEVPDRQGRLANVTLYVDSLEDYLGGHPFFGSVAGRYANRIGKGRFTLDGVGYSLFTNRSGNHIHGGKKGFDKYVWDARPVQDEHSVGVELTHVSPDGDEGYPGTLTVKVVYRLTDENALRMEYTANTDKPTLLNLTNHAYWNLSGAGSGDVLGHVIMLNADQFLPIDDTLLPLGELKDVKGTPMDFNDLRTIGSRIDQVGKGYDHCYVLKKDPGERLSLAARAVDPKSGRVMEVYTTQPGVQFFTANSLSSRVSGGGFPYGKHHGFCLETQHYPDSPNHPEYPSTVLRPGETFEEVTIHKFSVQK